MQIRFLHISDIHCGYGNYGVDQMREKLAVQLLKFTKKKGQTIDYLFVTGDLKYGAACKEGYPPETLAFIQEIQSTFSIKPEQTFVVPGNHDVKRGDMRTAAINGIKAAYQSHVGTISDEHLLMLDMTQQDYRNIYQETCGNSCRGNHFFVDLGSVNVIHLNTALICGSDGEDGSLIVGMSLLRDSLNGMDTSKSAIVLAHHSFDCLAQEEQVKLERLLKEKNALLYLCGHKHVNRFQKIASEVKDKPLWEILCGTNMDSAPKIEQTEMSVYVGTLDTTGNCGYIDAYKWSRRNEEWMPDSEFSHRECGTTDGRFYFPSREVNLYAEASERYLDYLCKTHSDIRLDGLPADDHVGSRRFSLDELYVPTRFQGNPPSTMIDDIFQVQSDTWKPVATLPLPQDILFSEKGEDKTEKIRVTPFERNPHNVILAGPGCGKTTYIKKVIKDHATGVCGDSLYPVLIRCRLLNKRSDMSIMNIIRDLPSQAEFPLDDDLRRAFGDFVCARLLCGESIMLIDGLDEISNSVDRDEFIRQLDTFSKTYPKNRILVTSRYAGYEDYRKSSLSHFDVLEIDSFSDDDIRQLCVKWHCAVVSDTQETITRAKELAETIIEHEQINCLAKNPLLLTTLLLVQRRVGRLPTRRVALYEEAIKVLLETWNQEGHAPMDLDLSVRKLAYIAYRMTCKGDKQATKKELLEYLYSAGEILGRRRDRDTISPEQFLKLTEQRSSILIRIGFKVDKKTGQFHDIYEFQHLTFQEYLTAVALKGKFYPGANRHDQVIQTLSASDGLNAFDPKNIKKEVILLTAALIGWDAEDIAEYLIELLRDSAEDWERFSSLAQLAVALLLDDVEIREEITMVLLQSLAQHPVVYYRMLYHSDLRDAAAEIALRNLDRWLSIGDLVDCATTFSALPYWAIQDDAYHSIKKAMLSWDDENRIQYYRLFLIFALATEPPITDGFLDVLTLYIDTTRIVINAQSNDPEIAEAEYFSNLLRRLEKYQAQHPEVVSFGG